VKKYLKREGGETFWIGEQRKKEKDRIGREGKKDREE